MAKKDLIGGSLWEQYSNIVNERMKFPRFRGELTKEEAKAKGGKLIIADWGAESCGDTVRLYWIVRESDDVILDARFKSFGCGTAIASSDVMSELCIGKTVDEAVKITNVDVEKALRDSPDIPAVPPQKMHCSVMAYDVIKKAASIYKNVDMDFFETEEIVCECARVSLATIKDVIKTNDLTTVAQITDYTKAGAFCKSCIEPGGHEDRKYYLVDILRETRNEMDKKSFDSEPADFASLTVVMKFREIERVLDLFVRDFLKKDGGNVEVIDIKETEDEIGVYINYQGACKTCAGSQGTAIFIEDTLQEKLDDKINIYIV